MGSTRTKLLSFTELHPKSLELGVQRAAEPPLPAPVFGVLFLGGAHAGGLQGDRSPLGSPGRNGWGRQGGRERGRGFLLGRKTREKIINNAPEAAPGGCR